MDMDFISIEIQDLLHIFFWSGFQDCRMMEGFPSCILWFSDPEKVFFYPGIRRILIYER